MAISTSVFCTQKKHIIFSANPTCIFIVGYNNLAFCCFQRCTYTPPIPGRKLYHLKFLGTAVPKNLKCLFSVGSSVHLCSHLHS